MKYTEQEIEDFKLAQARMVKNWKTTEVFSLILNTFLARKKVASDERRIKMRLQSTRENCLYHTGIEDGIQDCLDSIDKIISDGEEILAKKYEYEKLQEE